MRFPMPALDDDDQERRGRLLLLGKGAVQAHRLASALAAELDEKEQSLRDAARAMEENSPHG